MVGGYPSIYKTEIVSLTLGGQIPDCLNTLSDHPNEVRYGAGGSLPDVGYLPHVCGSGTFPHDECWQYSPAEDSWTKTSTIPRDFDSGAPAFHPGWGIIMSGGYPSYDEVTITKDGETFEDLTPMPNSKWFHCIAAVNSDILFTTGLTTGNGYKKTYLYYRDTGEWVPLPDMPTGRNGMGCGVVVDDRGSDEVVVVGGYDSGGHYLDTVEIFNLEEATWRTGRYFKQF